MMRKIIISCFFTLFVTCNSFAQTMDCYVQSTNDLSKVPVTITLENPITKIVAFEANLEIFSYENEEIETIDGSVNDFIFRGTQLALYEDDDRWNGHTGLFAKGSEYFGLNALWMSITCNSYLDPFEGDKGPLITVFFDASSYPDGKYVVKMFDALCVDKDVNSIESPEVYASFTIQEGKVVGVYIDKNMAEEIDISEHELFFNSSEGYKLSAYVIPEAAKQDVTWSSTNPAVASVSKTGEVTPLTDGTTMIIATTADGTNLSDTCIVNVKFNYKATSITLSKSKLMLTTVGRQKLTATISPSQASQNVTWSSSNSDVATVDAEGKVVSVSQGTAMITATTTDGSNLSASCEVTVVYIDEEQSLYDHDNSMNCYVPSNSDLGRVPVTITLENPTTDIMAIEANLEIFSYKDGNLETIDGSVEDFIFKGRQASYEDDNRWTGHTGTFYKGTAYYGRNALWISVATRYTEPFEGNKGSIITVFFDASSYPDGNYVIKMFNALCVDKTATGFHNNNDVYAYFIVKNGQVENDISVILAKLYTLGVEIQDNNARAKGFVRQGSDKVVEQGFKYWKKTGKTSSPLYPQAEEGIPDDAMISNVDVDEKVLDATFKNLEYDSEYSYVTYAITSRGDVIYGEEKNFMVDKDPDSVVSI